MDLPITYCDRRWNMKNILTSADQFTRRKCKGMGWIFSEYKIKNTRYLPKVVDSDDWVKMEICLWREILDTLLFYKMELSPICFPYVYEKQGAKEKAIIHCNEFMQSQEDPDLFAGMIFGRFPYSNDMFFLHHYPLPTAS